MSEEIVYKSRFDVPSREGVVLMLEWAELIHNVRLEFTDALDFVGSSPRNPLIYDDFAEYVIDAINERADTGWWYSLTGDFNVKLEIEE